MKDGTHIDVGATHANVAPACPETMRDGNQCTEEDALHDSDFAQVNDQFVLPSLQKGKCLTLKLARCLGIGVGVSGAQNLGLTVGHVGGSLLRQSNHAESKLVSSVTATLKAGVGPMLSDRDIEELAIAVTVSLSKEPGVVLKDPEGVRGSVRAILRATEAEEKNITAEAERLLRAHGGTIFHAGADFAKMLEDGKKIIAKKKGFPL